MAQAGSACILSQLDPILQGEGQESLHPNALGQQAIGTCLRLHFEAGPGDHRCTNTPGSGPEAMILSGA